MYCTASKVARDKDCLQNVFFFLPLGIKYKKGPNIKQVPALCYQNIKKSEPLTAGDSDYFWDCVMKNRGITVLHTYELRPTSNLFFYVFYRTGGIYYFSRHNFDPFIEVWAIWATRPPMGTSTEYKCWDQVSLILEIP